MIGEAPRGLAFVCSLPTPWTKHYNIWNPICPIFSMHMFRPSNALQYMLYVFSLFCTDNTFENKM